MATRILIADDHAAIRAGLREILGKRLDLLIVGEAVDGAQAIELAATLKPDVIILDLTMPGTTGLEVLQHLDSSGAVVRVIVFSMHPADQYAAFVRRSGARAFVSKDAPSQTLLDAIDRVRRGDTYFPSLVKSEADHGVASVDPGLSKLADLSARERAVLLGLAIGQSQVAIAQSLGISDKTVATYRLRVLEKLNLTNNAELVAFAARAGLAR